MNKGCIFLRKALPRFYTLTCSLPAGQVRRIFARQDCTNLFVRVRPARLRLYLKYRLLTTCSLLKSFVFIWKLRLAFVVFIGFTNEEYLISSVDFIVPCGVQWTPLPHPGVTAAAGLLPLTARVCYHFVLLVSGCFSMTEYRRWRGFPPNEIATTIAVSGNQKRTYRTYKRRLFSISTNEKQET